VRAGAEADPYLANVGSSTVNGGDLTCHTMQAGQPPEVTMTEQTRLKRRGLIAAAAGALAGAFVVGKQDVALAASGGGDQGPLNLGSNNFYKASAPNTNVAAVSSVATSIEASPNFGNYIGPDPINYVLGADARPAGGSVDGLRGFGTGGAAGVSAVGAEGGFGVLASAGVGVQAIGNTYGVRALSNSGYGMYSTGALAPLRLGPGSFAGAPTTGTHNSGEFVVDNTGRLFFCRVGGAPGTWAELTATPSPPSASPPSFKTLSTPERFVDTRIALGGVQGPLNAGATNVFQMTGRNGQSANPALQVPDNATVLVGNLTVVGGPGIPIGCFVTVWPGGPRPTVSNINFGAGDIVANSFVVGMTSTSGHGFINVFNYQTCDYILDITGYYS
jgi:hypothetical protein